MSSKGCRRGKWRRRWGPPKRQCGRTLVMHERKFASGWGGRVNDDDLMSLLREAHEEALPPAHFAAVRARVMSQVAASRRRRLWRWAWVALAAVLGLAAIGGRT